MKLATAYVEIAARTDEFRRQLREIHSLSTDSARDIGRTWQIAGSLPSLRPPAWGQTGGNRQKMAQTPDIHTTLSESRIAGDMTFWKQQLDLERKQLEVLQKQLEILKELRQGVPALLT